MLIKCFGLFLLIGIISFLIYLYLSTENTEKREYKGNVPGEQISFLQQIFDNNLNMTSKIQDFDTFKSYGELPVAGKLYTTTKPVKPYSATLALGEDIINNLNSNINAGKITATQEDSSSKTSIENKNLDNSSSLSGMNGGIEASIRESMVKSELSRLRR
jgi:hypothetical protein